ncbi:hypothetical protein BS17DRAFT_697981 [Gyrodon lividus]|nr:hypothetical protein BS17DRAFT_697981 [Gyrodon lividus]
MKEKSSKVKSEGQDLVIGVQNWAGWVREVSGCDNDLAVIQEPFINCVNLTTNNPQWNIVYPTCHNTTNATRTCSVILINANLSKDHWKTISNEEPNITVIEILGESGSLRIYNMYNERPPNS